MSKFLATIRTESHLPSLISQVGALANCLVMGGESAETEQSTPVKPNTNSHRCSRHWELFRHCDGDNVLVLIRTVGTNSKKRTYFCIYIIKIAHSICHEREA